MSNNQDFTCKEIIFGVVCGGVANAYMYVYIWGFCYLIDDIINLLEYVLINMYKTGLVPECIPITYAAWFSAGYLFLIWTASFVLVFIFILDPLIKSFKKYLGLPEKRG